jgi:transcriptional regulator with XRE-family HTH domain
LYNILFVDKIKELRKKQMAQRQFTATLKIDTPMYSKIERGDRCAKREQINVIAKLLQTEEDTLVTLWLADKIITTVGNEKEVANKAFKIAQIHIRS